MPVTSSTYPYQTSKHLVHQGTKAPPIDFFAIAFALQNLRSYMRLGISDWSERWIHYLIITQVLRCTTEGSRAVILGHEPFLADTKIGHADVAIGSQQQVLRLQIPCKRSLVHLLITGHLVTYKLRPPCEGIPIPAQFRKHRNALDREGRSSPFVNDRTAHRRLHSPSQSTNDR